MLLYIGNIQTCAAQVLHKWQMLHKSCLISWENFVLHLHFNRGKFLAKASHFARFQLKNFFLCSIHTRMKGLLDNLLFRWNILVPCRMFKLKESSGNLKQKLRLLTVVLSWLISKTVYLLNWTIKHLLEFYSASRVYQLPKCLNDS